MLRIFETISHYKEELVAYQTVSNDTIAIVCTITIVGFSIFSTDSCGVSCAFSFKHADLRVAHTHTPIATRGNIDKDIATKKLQRKVSSHMECDPV